MYTANVRRSLSNMQGRLVVHGNAEAGTALLRFSNMQSKCMFRRTTNILSCVERGFCIRYCILRLQVRKSPRPPVDWGPGVGKVVLFFSLFFFDFASKMSHRNDACLRAQEKMHPTCAKNPELIDMNGSNGVIYSATMPACHTNAEICREDPMCR